MAAAFFGASFFAAAFFGASFLAAAFFGASFLAAAFFFAVVFFGAASSVSAAFVFLDALFFGLAFVASAGFSPPPHGNDSCVNLRFLGTSTRRVGTALDTASESRSGGAATVSGACSTGSGSGFGSAPGR